MKRVMASAVLFAVVLSACGGRTPDPEASRQDSPSESSSDESASEKTKPGKKHKAADEKGKRDKKRTGPANGDAENAPGEDGDEGSSTVAGPTPGTGSSDDDAETNDHDGDASPPDSEAPPRAAAPIPAGEHEYATEGRRTISGNSEDFPSTTTLTTGPSRDGVQVQTRDLRDDEGHGTVTETHLIYRADGVYLSYVKVTSSFPGGFTDVREFDLPEPELIAPEDGGPGYRASFSMEGSGTRADVTIAASRWETVSVSGSRLRALVVETTIEFSGALEGRQRSLSWFWPRHLWVLKEQVETDVRNGPIRLQSDYSALLNEV